MKQKLPLIARLLLGLIFTVFGFLGLFNMLPPPPDMPEKLQLFNSGLAASGYFFTLLKLTEVVCGILLLSGRLVPLALVVLAPIVLNILCVHTFLEPKGLPIALIVTVLTVYLAFFTEQYSPKIKSLFKQN